MGVHVALPPQGKGVHAALPPQCCACSFTTTMLCMQLYHHKGALAALSAHGWVCSFTTTWVCMQLYQHKGVCEASSAQEYRWCVTTKGQVGHYLHTCSSNFSTTIMNTTFHRQLRSTIFMHWNRASDTSKEKKECILNCLTLSTESHWDSTNMLNKKLIHTQTILYI